MVRPFPIAAALAAALLFSPDAVRAQGSVAPPGAGSAEGEQLSVFLLTMGQGDLVWEKFGHNAIWIHDPAAGTDRVYNYGVFDFASPGYWSRFVSGDWLYQLAVFDIYETLAQYRYFDRTLVAQELNLTGPQKTELQRFLEWNALPENREYLYDYFHDNCSTRIRDALDRVLGGRLRESTERRPTGTTYRWHSRRLIASDPLAYTGLVAGLGPRADRPISQWEEAFLPQKLHERVREIEVEAPGGGVEPLVASEEVLYASAGRHPERDAPPNRLGWYLLVGAGIGAVLAGLAAAARASAAARLAFAASASAWALVVGTGGVLLVGLWAFTNHTIAHRNENLFHLDPLALGLVLLVPAMAYGARWAARPARLLSAAVAGISLLGLLLKLVPAFDQVNGEIIALLLPAHLALGWAVHRMADS